MFKELAPSVTEKLAKGLGKHMGHAQHVNPVLTWKQMAWADPIPRARTGKARNGSDALSDKDPTI